MTARTILAAIHRYGAIHICLVMFFLLCWLVHSVAFTKMEAHDRTFSSMNDGTMRAMALMDWVASHSWLVLGYVALVMASVGFLQIRGRPSWTYVLVASLFCIPCMLYWIPCAHIAGKLIVP